jgi:putative ABC transport system permease protein
MRQRALGTWLTMLSVVLGVALAVAIMILHREAGTFFGQKDYGFDVLIGAKGSSTQLVLNTVYHIDRSPGNIPYSVYDELNQPRHRYVRMAVPFAVGDSYEGHRLVATVPAFFGADAQGRPDPNQPAFEYRPARPFAIAQGRAFYEKRFEAVIGSDITRRIGLKIGDTFKATHGMPRPGDTPDIHEEIWTVVGVAERTNTANDRVIFIPLLSFYAMSGHDIALVAQSALRAGEDPDAAIRALRRQVAAVAATQPAEPPSDQAQRGHSHSYEGITYALSEDGLIDLWIPQEHWAVSAVLVRSRGGFQASRLIYEINNGPIAQAVNPASVMREFFQIFLEPSALILRGVSWLVTIVAAVGILVSIYNSVAARRREVAVLRALGATRNRVLLLICLEAGLIGLLGGILGMTAGHLLAGVGSQIMVQTLGEGINWLAMAKDQWLYLGAVVVLSVLAGLVPALKAYSTPVAEHLSGS